jgi:hypothetical protein
VNLFEFGFRAIATDAQVGNSYTVANMPRRRTLLTLALLMMLVAAGCGGAGTSPSPATPAPTPSPVPVPLPNPTPFPVGQFNFDGYVNDAYTKKPISGASLTLLTPSAQPVAGAQTDAAGHYAFGAVQSGTYTVSARASGYEDYSYQQFVVYAANLRFDFTLAPTGIVGLMLVPRDASSEPPCAPDPAGTIDTTVFNSSAYTVAVSLEGGLYEDPRSKGVVYKFTLPPSGTQRFPLVPGTYQRSGGSQDGNAILESGVAEFPRQCRLTLDICSVNPRHMCQ